MEHCLFCKIVDGSIPADKVLETDHVIAFRDIRPQAPVHVLVIPKRHIPSAHHITLQDAHIMGELHAAIAQVAEQEALGERGYRVVTNIGTHGQQTVPHLHYHVLGGRQLQWPPG